MSTGRVRLPAASIFSFSQIWGSGENGASPKVRQSTTRTQMGIDWINDHIVPIPYLGGHITYHVPLFISFVFNCNIGARDTIGNVSPSLSSL